MQADLTWKSLYKVGGVAALIVAALTLGEILFFIFYPQPDTISGWLDLFQSNALVAVLDFWGLEIPMYFMFILVFLALFVLLKETNQSLDDRLLTSPNADTRRKAMGLEFVSVPIFQKSVLKDHQSTALGVSLDRMQP